MNVYHGGIPGLSTTAQQTLTGSSNSSFGKALAIGDVNNDGYADLAVGAPGYNPGSASGTGAVYVHHGSIAGISGTAATTLVVETATDSFGVSVAIGNADGDSYDDLAVGAEGYGTSVGRAYVYHGASNGIGTIESRTLDGDALPSNDSNLDGYDDLVVSATNYDGTYSNQGKVYLYTGSSSGIPTARACKVRFGDLCVQRKNITLSPPLALAGISGHNMINRHGGTK